MSINRNIAASFLGNTWTALVQIAFIPLYIRILGIEAYGLIGVFAFLQISLSFLDMGLTPAVSREMARFRAGAHHVGEVRTLLRSVEVIFLRVALLLSTTGGPRRTGTAVIDEYHFPWWAQALKNNSDTFVEGNDAFDFVE